MIVRFKCHRCRKEEDLEWNEKSSFLDFRSPVGTTWKRSGDWEYCSSNCMWNQRNQGGRSSHGAPHGSHREMGSRYTMRGESNFFERAEKRYKDE